MATAKVRLHPEAIGDAVSAISWYRERSENAAKAFVAELLLALEHIASNPILSPRHRNGTRRLVLQRYPYSIVYRATGAEVEIVAVAHSRRSVEFWKRR